MDPRVDLWAAIGTWFGGLGSFAAAVVALYLARRSEKPRLKVAVGLRELTSYDGSPGQEFLCFDVTSLGDRPVTINSIGWAVGKRKWRKYCMQTVAGEFTAECPVELNYGKNAKFMVSFSLAPNWIANFAGRFVQDLSDRSLRTLVAQVHTSVGRTIEVRPEENLIRRLREYGRCPNSPHCLTSDSSRRVWAAASGVGSKSAE